MPTFHIETFGCQMNEHDSEGIAGILAELGLAPADRPQSADVIVLNTCSVRDRPHRKVFARLDDYLELKRRDPRRILVVAGCMAQLLPEELGKRAPHLDLIVGPGSYPRLKAAIAERMTSRQPRLQLLERCVPDEAPLPRTRRNRHRAWVSVMSGCDNHCAYCVVPMARGSEVSREPQAVVAEVRALVADGVVEVTLLGQNVNSYGRGLAPEVDFSDLLAGVSGTERLRRVRFTTSHPKDLSPKLMQAIAGLPNVCEHLHLPVQAGSDSVLARMGRGHTAQQYTDLVDRLRAVVPGVALTTDVMVGFPGETEEDFQATLGLFEAVRFDQAFMFRYDDRPGTRAAGFSDKVEGAEKQRRFSALVNCQNRIARDINEAQVGRAFEVLVESPDPKDPTKVRGRTRQNKLMIFPSDEDVTGCFVHVVARQARLWGWLGERA
jgi:tRNA-2-methylthio-N6-dimethylallyladenosine synthase